MNPRLSALQPYPFERLGALRQGVTPPAGLRPIALSIGEPQHPTPTLIKDALVANLGGLSRYPVTRGQPELRQSIASWLTRRFELPIQAVDPERHVLPVNGTREALFSFAQAVVDAARRPLVVMPNPFYQIYEGAALLAGATPYFVNGGAETGFLPEFDAVPAAVWQRCELLYVCSPGNPSGAVLSTAALQRLIALADRHDFVIASDECYSEIYRDDNAPPPGLLGAAAAMGNTDFRRCVVFHSLSKRSNAPGLRSGFVAGDADIIRQYGLYRTYHGCAMSLPVQHASIAAWEDESHVQENRRLYREKFAAVGSVLGALLDVSQPDGGFYCWTRTPGSDQQFARGLYAEQNVTVLPGSFLSRVAHGRDPGADYVRMALVASLDECVDAAHRIAHFVNSRG
ncbi:succinyldiaminopimelate transaminase [Methylolobus aquaticus]|nr:succinyldiaminopimelate transaminase [Methylolobus aquaticus]